MEKLKELCTEENALTSMQCLAKETGKTKICPECGIIIKEKNYGSLQGIDFIRFPKCECLVTKELEEEEQFNRQEKIDKLNRLFKRSRIGDRFKNATFENFKVTDKNEAVYCKMKEYAENFKDHQYESVLLFSHPGTGKTFISACIINEIIKKYYSTVFVVVPDLLSKIKSTYSNNGNTETELMNGLETCDLLILDDIGAERHTSSDDWANEKLFSIINNRYLSNKAIIFTTNLDANEMHDKLSARTFSRICEMTRMDFIDMNNIDDIRIYGLEV